MKLPVEEKGMDVISPLRVINIPRPATALTINLEEDEVEPPKATRLDRTIEAQPFVSTLWSSQPTFMLPYAIKSHLVRINLTRIRTLFNIPDEFQLRRANPKEQADWRSPGWVCFYEVAFIVGFRFPFSTLIRDFFPYFGISLSQVVPNVWRTLISLLILAKSSYMEFELIDLLLSYFLKEHNL